MIMRSGAWLLQFREESIDLRLAFKSMEADPDIVTENFGTLPALRKHREAIAAMTSPPSRLSRSNLSA